jgi:hypothetical protein
VPEDVAGIFGIDLPIMAAIFFFMDAFDKVPFILLMMQDPKSLTLY